ncbi:hypothetical protein FLGE108171_15600 [Flavobacterium gelidilacus]|uniref:hypothetical protein n=1 Tax=Flavobacterium TaxID=237 RepID=UPI000417F6CA|nr:MULTISPECIES: hypothetical protein [Flavobacterium]
MKKIILFAMLFISLHNYAQKTLEIYNFTSSSVVIYDIFTKPTAGMYPEFHSKPYGGITILPGDSYILENTTNVFRFPFNSPSSIPFINIWERLNSATSVTNLNSNIAWTLGNSQVYKGMIFQFGSTWNNFTPLTASEVYPGVGFDVYYDYSNPATNVNFYTNVFI